MNTSNLGRRVANYLLRRAGYQIHSIRRPDGASTCDASHLPIGAPEYLRAGNPRLKQLKHDYSRFDRHVTESRQWTRHTVRGHDLLNFRGDNAYVWQVQGGDREANYAISARHIESIDKSGLLDRLTEDGAFGAHVFNLNGRKVSRDLLDSVAELCFLDRHLGIFERPDLRILDIGAGYGRMAHRMVTALPNVTRFLCTDAIPVSTFISEYYLKFRGIDTKATAVPVTDINSVLEDCPIDLAINVHSFSECRIQAVTWWLRIMRDRNISHVFVVPNALDHGGTRLLTNAKEDLMPLFTSHGFELTACEPKYLDPFTQQYGVQPTHYYLFRAR
jgi:hypothetical protein